MSEKLTIYQHNGICLIVEMQHVEVLGRKVTLTKTLFNIFEGFMRRPDRIFSRRMIIDLLCRDYEIPDRQADVLIKRLRRALFPNDYSLSRRVIVSVYGEGYLLANLRKGRQ